MPFGSRQRVPETPGMPKGFSTRLCSRLHLHLSSRNTRWSHCPANVIQHPDPGRINTVLIFVVIMLFTNTYRVIEKWIIAFVSIIGLSFIYELSLVEIDWNIALPAWVTPCFPRRFHGCYHERLGAVVMPHNLFLHSEVIQSRQWNIQDDKIIKKQLRYEYADTILSMVIGWAINSAMILLAAAAFFGTGTPVTELEQANSCWRRYLGIMPP